jgi:hypothetical protein
VSSLLAPVTLSIRLTDPPTVPEGTMSLNLTYSSLQLLVGAKNGSVYIVKSLDVNTSGTVNLLSIQNVSQTVAIAKVQNGSLIYSIDFVIESVSIDINGTVYPVQPVLNGDTLKVVFYPPANIEGDSVALVQISPVVVKTATGYQMIPTTVAIVKHEKVENEAVGQTHKLKDTEESELNEARALLFAKLESISVSGNVTSFTILVNNTGRVPASLIAIALHANFNATCTAKHPENHGNESAHDHENETAKGCEEREHLHPETIFFRVTNVTKPSNATANSCASAVLTPSNEIEDEHINGTQLAPGQCILLNFQGRITNGESNNILIPVLTNGSKISLHVIASNAGEVKFLCSLPLTPQSCVIETGRPDESD